MELLTPVLFYALAGLTAVCAVAVVVTRNIVRASTWLLFTLAGVAGLFFLIGADFLGATQLLIYVGGTLVLVVFGVMLTAQGPFVNLRISAAEWAISLGAGLLLYGLLASALLNAEPPARPELNHPLASSRQLGSALLGDDGATPPATITAIPGSAPLRTRTPVNYLLPFEVVSVHLLVVLIGAAYLARAKRRAQPARGTNA